MTRPFQALCVSVTLAAAVSGGCVAPPSQPTAALAPIALPDLTRMAESVRTQIQARHSALTALIVRRTTPPLDLSNAYGDLGKLLLAAQSADVAEACFLNAQTLNPSNYRWPYYLAQLYRTKGEPRKAQPLLERTIQLHPEDVAARVWLGDIHLQLGRPDAAEPQFSQALSLQPNSLSARFGLGRAALAKNDYRGAVSYLEDVLARDPKAASAHYPLSLAYTALGETTKAADHLRQRANHEILPADPLMVEIEGLLESPQTYETQGIRALEREDWTGAAEQFRQGLALAPDSAALHHRLGSALSMMGHTDAARRQFEEAVRLSPDYFLSQYSLGVMLQADGRHRDAIERFAAAVRSRPIYTEARLRMASSLQRTRRTTEALAEYQQVLSGSAELTEARLGYAMSLAQLGRYGEARDRLTAARQTGPDRSIFTHGLARLLATAPDDEVRDGQRALTLVQEMLTKGRTLELGETMAMALAELGQFERAASVQRDLLATARKAGLANTVAARLRVNLQRYERLEPCRTPWTLEEMP